MRTILFALCIVVAPLVVRADNVTIHTQGQTGGFNVGSTNDANGGALSLGDWSTPHTLSIFSTSSKCGPVAIIHADGTVEIAKCSTPNKAALAFWRAVEQSNPLRAEVERLRRELAACRER